MKVRSGGGGTVSINTFKMPIKFFKMFGLSAYIHTRMHAYIHTYIHACIHTYVHTYVRVCVCVCTWAGIFKAIGWNSIDICRHDINVCNSNSPNCVVLKPNIKCFGNSFTYSGANDWNEITIHNNVLHLLTAINMYLRNATFNCYRQYYILEVWTGDWDTFFYQKAQWDWTLKGLSLLA